jgi:hypothetical protein
MAFGDNTRQPHPRVSHDLVEVSGRIPISEEGRELARWRYPVVGRGAIVLGRFPAELFFSVSVARVPCFQLPPVE